MAQKDVKQLPNEIQVVSYIKGYNFVSSLEKAFEQAKGDKDVYKISFKYDGQYYRLVRQQDAWENRPMKLRPSPPYGGDDLVLIPDDLMTELKKTGYKFIPETQQ